MEDNFTFEKSKGEKKEFIDRQTKEEEKQGCLHTVFLDGKMLNETSLENIRKTRLHYAYKAVLDDNEF